MSSKPLRACIALVLACSVVSQSGCRRGGFRRAADDEASFLIAQKANGPKWNLQQFSVYPGEASRMHDPYSPDREPLPQDDPASHTLMHSADGKKGYRGWHRNGDTAYVENPCWRAYLPLDEEGNLVVDSTGAVRLARLHSPVYQTELEDLFLSALDVSTERFFFDTQFFGGYGTNYTVAGPFAQGSTGVGRSQLTNSTRGMSISRMYNQGASVVVNFANTLVWQFSGPVDSQSGNTLLSYSFVQPFLRSAGRDKIFERLTLAERTLLANCRQMEFYRQGFFMNVTTGTGSQQGPTRRGGVFGAGLTGFTGIGGGFGNLGGVGGAGGGGLGGTQAGGFLGLIQTQQTLRNQESNVAALRSSLTQLEAFRRSGRIDYFQVEQVRQQLFDSTSQLLANKQNYQGTLDSYKATLGLPPQLNVKIEDTRLEPFRLIDPRIIPLQTALATLQTEVGEAILPLLSPPAEVGEVEWRRQVVEGLATLADQVEAADELRVRAAEEAIDRGLADVDAMKEVADRRKEFGAEMRSELRSGRQALLQDVDASLFDTEYLEGLPEALRAKLLDVRGRLEKMESLTKELREHIATLSEQATTKPIAELEEALRDQVLHPFPALLTDMSTEFLQASLEQTRARTEKIVLPPVDIDARLALEVARQNRLDWMNARASLVDSYRLLEFNADDLEGFLNLVFSGDVVNRGDQPFNLGAASSRMQLGLQFDAPFTRLQERNIYRQSLIEYQRARRNYYQYQDTVARDLRNILRQVQLDKVNFELRRRALRVAVEQVRLARLELLRPPVDETSRLGPTTALNLINSLNSLRSAQDAFLGVWVDYEIQRGLLDLAMGTMQLDDDGLWMDPQAIGVRYGYPDLTPEIVRCLPQDLLEALPDESRAAAEELLRADEAEEIETPDGQRPSREELPMGNDQGDAVGSGVRPPRPGLSAPPAPASELKAPTPIPPAGPAPMPPLQQSKAPRTITVSTTQAKPTPNAAHRPVESKPTPKSETKPATPSGPRPIYQVP